MKLIIDISEDYYNDIVNRQRLDSDTLLSELVSCVDNGTPLEEISNPCIECSQNCCVCELNGEKCECQKIYVVKENK